MSDDAATVLDIVLACRRLRRFVESVDEGRFQADEEKRWATVSQLLLIGEAARRLSDAFQAAHGDIPWPQITAMRNRLIHEYDRINWHLVWKTATTEVPHLIARHPPRHPVEGPPRHQALTGERGTGHSLACDQHNPRCERSHHDSLTGVTAHARPSVHHHSSLVPGGCSACPSR